ncbi:hypothetical protein OJAV_G00118690 [Oryzias javanicus]|uniref:Uncharacterized protein n=1 Tax=Oryzias javanicus TaxID=123683 RepID=A0A3S2U8Y3_ORYJA|nr:hypothetical protein OJAV_G00118690 [Oryzias javanicus]
MAGSPPLRNLYVLAIKAARAGSRRVCAASGAASHHFLHSASSDTFKWELAAFRSDAASARSQRAERTSEDEIRMKKISFCLYKHEAAMIDKAVTDPFQQDVRFLITSSSSCL